MEHWSLGPLTGGKGRPVLISKFLDQLRGVGGHDAALADEPELVIAANRQHPGMVPLLEHPPQAVIRAIGRIGQHPGHRGHQHQHPATNGGARPQFRTGFGPCILDVRFPDTFARQSK